MRGELLRILNEWPSGTIRDFDLAISLPGSDASRYALVKRAIESGLLVRLRRGLYLIGPPVRKGRPDLFELAQHFTSPSAISFESALSYHGWVPEAVYTVYSSTPKRRRRFETPVGSFEFFHTPLSGFYEGVERSDSPCFFISTPWKALADLLFVKRLDWGSLEELIEDLRLDEDLVLSSGPALLQQMAEEYGSPRVRRTMARLLEGWP